MADQVTTHVLGTHEIRIEGDTIFLIQQGDYSLDDALKTHAEIEGVLNKLGRVFVLVDQSHAGQTSPEARRSITEWNKRHRASGSAVFGGSRVSRAAATLVITAIRLFKPDTAPTIFTESEAEARAWIAERRQKLLGAP
jgi:hypothetical protein